MKKDANIRILSSQRYWFVNDPWKKATINATSLVGIFSLVPNVCDSYWDSSYSNRNRSLSFINSDQLVNVNKGSRQNKPVTLGKRLALMIVVLVKSNSGVKVRGGVERLVFGLSGRLLNPNRLGIGDFVSLTSLLFGVWWIFILGLFRKGQVWN